MRRILLLLGSATLALGAAPAAAFDTCAYDAATKTVTATYGIATTGELERGAGGLILADGVQCAGAATVTNTDTVKVVGDSSPETLEVRLGGGALTPGFTAEAC